VIHLKQKKKKKTLLILDTSLPRLAQLVNFVERKALNLVVVDLNSTVDVLFLNL